MATAPSSSGSSAEALKTTDAEETDAKKKKSKKKPKPDFLGGLQKQIEEAEKEYKKALKKWTDENRDKHPPPTPLEPLDGSELLRRLESLHAALVSDWIESHHRKLLDKLDAILEKYGDELNKWLHWSRWICLLLLGPVLGVLLFYAVLWVLVNVYHIPVSRLPGLSGP
jgi:hypothetical protein